MDRRAAEVAALMRFAFTSEQLELRDAVESFLAKQSAIQVREAASGEVLLPGTAWIAPGDHHMALALVGAAESSLPGPVSASYRRLLMQWQERAVRHINRSIGYVPGTLEHRFHGRKAARKYIDRWEMFLRHGFDPDTDVKRNSSGVLELAGNKPELARELNLYFRNRDEDANSLGDA